MAYGDSPWTYGNVTLTNPGATAGHSPWKYGTVTLVDPTPSTPVGDSPWTYGSGLLRRPHHPIGVMTAAGVRYVRVLAWDGTALR